jgi:hypothetical protein
MVLHIYFSRSIFLSDISRMYGEMRSTLDMSYYQTQINIHADRVWSIDNCNYAKGYKDYIPDLQKYISLYEQSFNEMAALTNNYPYGLEYNSNNRYNFTFSLANNS